MFVNNIESLNKLNRKRTLLNQDTIVLIFSNRCGPCHMFLPVWKQFVENYPKVKKNKKKRDLIAIEVEYLSQVKNEKLKHMIEKMSEKNPYVPNIAKYSIENNKITMFKSDRTKENLTLFSQ